MEKKADDLSGKITRNIDMWGSVFKGREYGENVLFIDRRSHRDVKTLDSCGRFVSEIFLLQRIAGEIR